MDDDKNVSQSSHEGFVQWDAQREGDLWGEFYASLYNRYGMFLSPPEITSLAQKCYEELSGLKYLGWLMFNWDAMTKVREQGLFMRSFRAAFNQTRELKS